MMVAAVWGRRRGGSAGYGAQASADRRTRAGTTPATGDRADYSPGAGPDQAAGNRAIGGIVRLRKGPRRRYQSSAITLATVDRSPIHFLR